MSRTVLVTGGAGFLGSHLVERLVDLGDHVIVVDNLLTGRRENLQPLLDAGKVHLIEEDAARINALPHPVDDIYHLASPASPPDYHRWPFETMRVGAHATINLLELARRDDARFLLASTSEVYGDPQISPQPESYWGNVNPIGPRAVYDEAKRFAEAATSAAAREWGIPVRIARIFNTYGPRMRPDDGRVVSNFICQALRNEPLTVYGDGWQTRSFCYVDDLVQGLALLMEAGDGSPVNLGNPEERSVLELAETILQLTGAKVPIQFRPLPEDDPKQRRPEIEKAAQQISWRPTVSLETGLKRTIDHFREVQRPPAVEVVR